MRALRRESRCAARTCALALAALALCACTSLSIERDTLTSGTFRSRAWSFTILSWDLPKAALDTARENASDTRLLNLQVKDVDVTPDWGWWNWVLDILSVRVATIRGTWGFSEGPPAPAGEVPPEPTPGG
jgi:hypothetical protein